MGPTSLDTLYELVIKSRNDVYLFAELMRKRFNSNDNIIFAAIENRIIQSSKRVCVFLTFTEKKTCISFSRKLSSNKANDYQMSK